MSGTRIKVRRQMERQRIEAAKAEELAENRRRIKEEICRTFGWKALDQFAEEMLERTLDGKIVDMPKLIHDLRKWQEEQTKGGDANGDNDV